VAFTTLYAPGNSTRNYPVELILTNLTTGELTKSPREKLALGGPGEIDELFLTYEGFVHLGHDIGTLFDFGDEPSGIVAPGRWFVAGIGTPEYNGSWCSVTVRCEGLYAAKPDRIRWFSTTEQQQADNITLVDTGGPLGNATFTGRVAHRACQVGCEIDTIIVGGEPDTSQVGLRATPSPAPSVRGTDWDWLASPTYNWRNGWVLENIRAANVAGLDDVWLATYVYQYIYTYSP
jgi:hypothetical protein